MATDHHPTYTIAEAARLLGISENAVRKRIRRETIGARKDGERWLVALPGHPPTNGAAITVVATTTTDQATVTGETTPRATTGVVGGLAAAIQPLADLIADLQQENRRLAESATLWQERARGLQEQMKALTAGETAQDAAHTPSTSPGGAELTDKTDEPRSSFRAWWRRLWGGA